MVYSILSTLSKETEITIDSWGVLIIAAIAHDVGTGECTHILNAFRSTTNSLTDNVRH